VSEFAQAVGDLAASYLGKYVSHLLETLAELERKAETESAQARADQASDHVEHDGRVHASRQLGSGERHEPVLFNPTG
jgi:hypothetical protein